MEGIVKAVPGAVSVYSERAAGGRYIQIDSDRIAAARYGLNVDDVHDVSRWKGARGFPINILYPQEWRDSVERLRALPIVVAHGPQFVLSDVARVAVVEGPGADSQRRRAPCDPGGLSIRATMTSTHSCGRRPPESNKAGPCRRVAVGAGLGRYEHLEREFISSRWSCRSP